MNRKYRDTSEMDEDLDPLDLQQEVLRIRRSDEARRLARTLPFVPPQPMTFDQVMALPKPEVRWMVDKLMGCGHNVLLSAPYKAGKSTLILNLLKSLVDNKLFLGRFEAELSGRVLFMNYELTDDDAKEWIEEMKWRRPRGAVLLNLRGRPNPLASDNGRAWLVSYMQEQEIQLMAVDTFRAAYSGVSHNDNAEVGHFTRMLDQVKMEAGVEGLLLSNHFGRQQHEMGAEHGAGATELDNWADMRWLLTRGEGDHSNDRFLKAEGRIEGMDESLLTYIHEVRRLELLGEDLGVNKNKIQGKALDTEVLEFVSAHPGLSTTAIKEGIPRNVRAVGITLTKLTDQGYLIKTEKGKATIYHVCENHRDQVDFGGLPARKKRR